MPKGPKHPKAPLAHATGAKQPRVGVATGTDHLKPSWQLSALDVDGAWGWEKLDGAVMCQIRERLRSFELMTWTAIKSNGTHTIPVQQVCPDAQKRLAALNQDDIDDLVSLRVGGKERIWGIRDGAVLRLLWWDPKHEVYPVEKKHT